LEVNYSELYPQLDPSENDENKFFCDALLTKAKQWSYEKEFRVIAKEGDSENYISLESGFLSLNPTDLVSIIVGCLVTADDIQTLKKILKERKSSVELYQVRPASDRYSLVIQDL
jgi:hypothetical protein